MAKIPSGNKIFKQEEYQGETPGFLRFLGKLSSQLEPLVNALTKRLNLGDNLDVVEGVYVFTANSDPLLNIQDLAIPSSKLAKKVDLQIEVYGDPITPILGWEYDWYQAGNGIIKISGLSVPAAFYGQRILGSYIVWF